MPTIDPGKETPARAFHKGYNESNPARPEGAFVADSVQKDTVKPGKQPSEVKLKKRKEKITGKKVK